MKSLFRIFILLLCVIPSYGQYVTVSTSATLREEPSSKSTILLQLTKGQHLKLLEDGKQTNGFYRVLTPLGQDEGYIYRTLVRRFEGTIPGSPGPVGTRTIVSKELNWVSQVPTHYYDGTATLSGQSLKDKLHVLIDGHTEYPYTAETTDVYDILKVTDQDPGNPENVILIYSGFSVNGAQEYNDRKGWEREHVWSQSHGQFGRLKGPGSDVHHLRPILSQFNGSAGKSNKDFDTVGKPFVFEGSPTGCLVSDSTWAPISQVRGDVARMMFYMAVRYEGDDGYPDLELVNCSNTEKLFPDKPVYGNLQTLLQWHKQDPVDNWERRRNDIIYTQYQKNRNPFIDHPEFVERIWGR